MTNTTAVDDDGEHTPVTMQASPEELPPGAPRRFVLIEYHAECGPTVYLWGVQVPGGAIGFGSDGKPVVQAGSAERALRLFGRVADLDLLWLDPPPATPAPAT